MTRLSVLVKFYQILRFKYNPKVSIERVIEKSRVSNVAKYRKIFFSRMLRYAGNITATMSMLFVSLGRVV